MPLKDQFRLRALLAIQGGSARHLGTSLEKQALGVKFTAVLSLPIFSLLVYPFSCRVVRLRRMVSLELSGSPAISVNLEPLRIGLEVGAFGT